MEKRERITAFPNRRIQSRYVFGTEHSFGLREEEEKLFRAALYKRYGGARGSVLNACVEAVLEWSKKVMDEG